LLHEGRYPSRLRDPRLPLLRLRQEWEVRTTLQPSASDGKVHLDICSNCHPFYTGKQKLIDKAGRVERFRRKYAKPSDKDAKPKRRRQLLATLARLPHRFSARRSLFVLPPDRAGPASRAARSSGGSMPFLPVGGQAVIEA